jgi:hypothetical protein
MTLDELKGRIGRELALLGDFSDTADDLIRDALTDFVQAIQPLINTTVAAVNGTLIYSIPATIDLIERLETASGLPVPYVLNKEARTLTLQNNPETGNLTMYGTPNSVRTNAAAIIEGLDEDCGSALWQHIRATFYSYVNDSRADAEYLKAEKADHKLLQYLSSTPAMVAQPMQMRDVTGGQVGDDAAADGISVQYPSVGEAMEY